MKSFKDRLKSQLLKEEAPTRPMYNDGDTGDREIRSSLQNSGLPEDSLDTEGQMVDPVESFSSLKDEIEDKAAEFFELVDELIGRPKRKDEAGMGFAPPDDDLANDLVPEEPTETPLLQKVIKLASSPNSPEAFATKGDKIIENVRKASDALNASATQLMAIVYAFDLPEKEGRGNMPAPSGPTGPSPV